MSTVKVKFRPSSRVGEKGSVFYQVIHKRKTCQLGSGLRIFAQEWDVRRGMVLNRGANALRVVELEMVCEQIKRDLSRIARILNRLEKIGIEYDCSDIAREFANCRNSLSFVSYMEGLIGEMNRNGCYATAGHYRATLNSVGRFMSERRANIELYLDEITARLVADYEGWLRSRGVTRNTSSFYLRILRAAYNRAADEGLIEQCKPFKRVYTGIDRTVKRAVSVETLTRLRTIDLSRDPMLDYARDMFLMSFYLRGMSFVDMSFLRKTDLRDGTVVYRRRKTGQKLIIKWMPQMQEILDKYAGNDSEFLLPIIKRKGEEGRRRYLREAEKVNRGLKKIAPMVGAGIKLTHYVARHSWASTAQRKNIPIKIISEGMGHDCESTTRIYLASLDTAEIDLANAKILESL